MRVTVTRQPVTPPPIATIIVEMTQHDAEQILFNLRGTGMGSSLATLYDRLSDALHV